MALVARESGARRVFATPHYMPGVYSPTPEEIKSTVALLRRKITEEGLDLEIVEGSEVSFTEWLSRDFKEGKLVPLGGSDFILVELPSLSLPAHATGEVFALKLAGAGVILAHPERNSDLRRSPGILRGFVETGVYLQVNAGSFVGEYGKDVQTFAGRLLKEGLVHFLGSDAHSGAHPDLVRGGPDLRPALEKVFRSVADPEEFVAGLEQRVEDLLSGRLR
jgi:protein-tyrosine phosphatase